MKNINPRFIIFPTIGLLLIIGWAYVRQGGLDVVNVSTETLKHYKIIGQAYEGTTRDEGFRKIIEKIHTQNQNGNLPGTLAIVFSQDPTIIDKENKVILGVIPEKNMDVPTGMETFAFEGGRVVQAQINQEVLLTPNPEDVLDQIRKHAEVNSFELKELYLETYEGNIKRISVPIAE